MRHRVAGRHLGRDTAHRKALYRNLVTDLLRYERITTTEAKAKEIRPMAEKMITLGIRGDLHARRQALRFIYDKHVVEHVFDQIAPRMSGRPGGYLRITKTEPRVGDGAAMAVIELVDYHGTVTPETGPRERVAAAPAPQATTAAPPAGATTTEVPAEPAGTAEPAAADEPAAEGPADEGDEGPAAEVEDNAAAEADEEPAAQAGDETAAEAEEPAATEDEDAPAEDGDEEAKE